jgi:hypothetical protein
MGILRSVDMPNHHRQHEQSAERCAEEKGKEYGDDVGETHVVSERVSSYWPVQSKQVQGD